MNSIKFFWGRGGGGLYKCLSWQIPESIEWFIEDQAFAPRHPLTPSPVSKLSLSQSSCVSPVELTVWRGEGDGAKSYDREIVWSSIHQFNTLCQIPICWSEPGRLIKREGLRIMSIATKKEKPTLTPHKVTYCALCTILMLLVVLRSSQEVSPESIEWFIESQDFLRSHDSAPRPPPPPSPILSSISDTQEDWEREATCWREGGGHRAKSYDRKKAGPSINHSVLPGWAKEAAPTPRSLQWS